MAKSLSVYRRRTNLVDLFLVSRTGAKSYTFKAAVNFDVGAAPIQSVPQDGFRSPTAFDSGPAEGFRGRTRFTFNPADYGLDDTIAKAGLEALDEAMRVAESDAVRARVEKARAIQRARFDAGEVSVRTNAHLSQRDVERVCRLDAESRSLIAQAVDRRGLSARAYGKVLRLARTIADMEGAAGISARHVSEALAGRVLDRDTDNGRPLPATDAA